LNLWLALRQIERSRLGKSADAKTSFLPLPSFLPSAASFTSRELPHSTLRKGLVQELTHFFGAKR
jgi:hypothetical protein